MRRPGVVDLREVISSRLSSMEARVAEYIGAKEMTVPETARALGISEDQVRQHIHRIRKKSKKALSDLKLSKPWELSGRQLEVARLRAGGHSVAEICSILGIKASTVRCHVHRARLKERAGPCEKKSIDPSAIPSLEEEPFDALEFDFRVSTSYPTKDEALAAASTGLGTREEREVLFRERRKLRKKFEVCSRNQLLRAEGFWRRLLRDVLEDCFFKVDGSWAPKTPNAWRVLEEERDLRLQELSSSQDGLLVLRRPAPNRLAVASAARRVEKPESSGVAIVTGLGPGCSIWVGRVERKVSEVVFCLKRKQYLSCDSVVLLRGDVVSDAGEGRLLVLAWSGDLKPWMVHMEEGRAFEAGAA